MMSGLEQLAFLKELNVKVGMANVGELFEKICGQSVRKSAFVTSAEELPEISVFMDEISSSGNTEAEPFQHELSLDNSQRRHYTLEGCMVNYVSLAIPAVENQQDYAKLAVLCSLVSSKFCHPMIRERRGAYGSGIQAPKFGADLKTLRFFSYRDPANLDTLSVFKHAYYWAVNKTPPLVYEYTDLPEWTETDLKEAKLRTFQQMDSPVDISQLGNAEVFSNFTQKEQDQFRLDVLNVTEEDVLEMAEKYLNLEDEEYMRRCGVCIIGPKEYSLEGKDSWKMLEI